MQRTRRATAGNIYKQRLHEIQMEAPRLRKSKGKPKTAVIARAPIDRPKRAVRVSPKSGSFLTRDERESSFEYALEFDDADMESAPNNDDDSYHIGGTSSKSGKASGNTAAIVRFKKDMLRKFNCPHCKARFAEERYVAFHCKQVHKGLYEEKPKPANNSFPKHGWIGHVAQADDEDDNDSKVEQTPHMDYQLPKSEPIAEVPSVLPTKVGQEPEKVEDQCDARGDEDLCAVTDTLLTVPSCVGLEISAMEHDVGTLANLSTPYRHIVPPTRPTPESLSGRTSSHRCHHCAEQFLSVLNLQTHINTHRIKGTTINNDRRESAEEETDSDFKISASPRHSSSPNAKRPLSSQPPPPKFTKLSQEAEAVTETTSNAVVETDRQEQYNSGENVTSTFFPCPHCPRIIYDQDEYNKHQRAHEIMKNHATSVIPSSNSMIPVKCKYCDKLWASTQGLVRHLKMAHAQALGYKPAAGISSVVHPFAARSTPKIPISETQTHPPLLISVPDKILNPKPIEVIDLSDEDDQEQESGNQTTAVGSTTLGTIVNVDGQDVDAIEVLTEDELNSSSLMEPLSPSSLVEVEVTIVEGYGEDDSVMSVSLPKGATNLEDSESTGFANELGRSGQH